MPKKLPKIPTDPHARHLCVQAVAHAMMYDLLTDLALRGDPVPASLDAMADPIAVACLGDMTEETFLQANAPQWSIACSGTGPRAGEVEEFWNDARAQVDVWLGELTA